MFKNKKPKHKARKPISANRKKNFICKQCGRCCLLYGAELPAFPADLERWENEGREDILYWANIGDLWVNDDDGKEANRCPFLRKLPRKKKYKCLIYETRPEVCRGYPYTEEQVITDRCKGFAHAKKN